VALTAITLLDPLTGVVIGVTAFHEKISTGGPLLVIELVAVLAMASGIWLAGGARAERGSFAHVED